MPRRYSFDSDTDERQPLDNSHAMYSSAGSRQQQYQQQYQQPYQEQYSQHHQTYYDQQQQQQPPQPPPQQHQYQPQHQIQQPPPPPQQQQQQQPRQRPGPGSHPDSSFNRLAAHRRYSRDQSVISGSQAPPQYLAAGAAGGAAAAAAAQHHHHQTDPVSPISPPQPPPHRDADGRYWGHELGYSPPVQTNPGLSNITPGADNFSDSAAGGMAGIAYTVAERNARESGLEATRPAQPHHHAEPNYPQQAYQASPWHGQDAARAAAVPLRGRHNQPPPGMPAPGMVGGGEYPPADRDSHSSLQGLGAAAVTPGNGSPGMRTPSRSPHSFANDVYTDDPYQGYSRGQDPHLGVVNPNDIEDDGDDGLVYGRSRGPRTSMLSLGGQSNRSGHNNGAAAGAAGAAAGGVMGGLMGRSAADRNHHNHRAAAAGGSGGQYNPVYNGGNPGYAGSGGSGYGAGPGGEKSAWLSEQRSNRKKWKWAIIVGIGLVVAGGVAAGIVFGVVLKNKNGGGTAAGGGSSSQTAAGDTAANGDLDINSPEIQGLLNNGNLHKVFPGIDYTPVNTQYPDCLANPPSQNNVTRDVAVLSQLTNTIRLYGTDCNQTEMTIHAIRQLKMTDSIKIWMGVWQDNNVTTNARQLAQMWTILDTYGADPFKGVIVANEILFREQMTTAQLGQLLSSVRTNMTAKSISLPVATSDLGDKWDSALASVSDYVMANIHPFFGGINANQAASWTWSFWENHSSGFFKADASKNVISETGWPSQGGTDCGSATVTDCPDAATAGIDQMNRFMADWVCQALTNGTQYFWFEAFDEPWKVRFDQGSQNWEDHWGLMDVNRNLKPGVKIPDCGGKTV